MIRNHKGLVLMLIVCLLMGYTVGFAETAALESAMDKLSEAESMTVEVDFAVQQNGTDAITGTMTMQTAGEKAYTTGNIMNAAGESRDMEMSSTGGSVVVRIGNDYYTMPVDEIVDSVDEDASVADIVGDSGINTDNMRATVEGFLGTAADKMVISDSGFSLHLEGNEIPALLNLALSMAGDTALDGFDAESFMPGFSVENAVKHGTKGDAVAEDIDLSLNLGTGLRISRIDIDMPVTNETIEKLDFGMALTGLDADGAPLETSLSITLHFTDLNATAPGEIDTTGIVFEDM